MCQHPAETAVWDKIQEPAARFRQADRIVLGVPMWNFAYPYKYTGPRKLDHLLSY
jgi:FMN-dependent NADH-azoreductase